MRFVEPEIAPKFCTDARNVARWTFLESKVSLVPAAKTATKGDGEVTDITWIGRVIWIQESVGLLSGRRKDTSLSSRFAATK